MLNSIIQSCDEFDSQILLPISSLFPPNEIVKKDYTPDIKPTFRLMTQQKKDKKRVTFGNQTRSQYADLFGEMDSLGYEYSSLLKKDLVYLKFNNTNYMKLAIKAGMFIPIEKLLDQNLKKMKNVYKLLPNIDFVDYKSPVDSSFGVNCCSSAPALRFTSNYETSNLFAAIRTGDTQYDLILQNDINSKGNTQWFNFTIEINQQKNYKFNIVNLTKSISLYQKGMSIAMFSQSNRLHNKIGWMRGGQKITYTKTSVNREDNQDQFYYKLHFQYRSIYKNDIVTFSYCYPYSLIDLEKFFQKVMKKVTCLKIDKIKLAQTLSGFSINIYSISFRRTSLKKRLSSNQTFEGLTTNSSIIFMARQHPGESQGSYILEGVVQWLLQNNYDSCKKDFNFYVVPMINMDGVFYGNYRTNLSGNDLNRVWRQPRKDYHFEIYSLKKFFISLNKTSPISLIIDIHGHSNSLNSFFYGNPQKKDLENPKFFPFFCSRRIKQISYQQSTFSISENKKNCARVVLSQIFPKALVYTFENSFYGWKKGKHIIEHTIESYKKLGRQLVHCCIDYFRLCDKNPGIKQKWLKQIQQIQKQKQQKIDLSEVMTQSDVELEKQVIQFIQMPQQFEIKENRESTTKFRSDRKQKTDSRRTTLRYLRRHSPPTKLKIFIPAYTQNYIIDKSLNVSSESQGFLSIVKISTRSNLETVADHGKLMQSKKSLRYLQDRKENIKDEILQDQAQQIRESKSENCKLVGKLINQKELVMQKIKQKRLKLDLHSKTANGFLRYTNPQK